MTKDKYLQEKIVPPCPILLKMGQDRTLVVLNVAFIETFETWFKNIEIISNLNSCIFLLNVVSLQKKG